jgi:aminopeptidase N
MFSYDRYGTYPSGGVLSEAQAQFDVLFYDLNLEVNSEDQSLSGYITIKIRNNSESLQSIELDLIDNFDVVKISDNLNNELQFEHDGGKLNIQTDFNLKFGETIDLSVYYEGQPIEALWSPWIGGFNWSKDSTGADWIGLACQGEGAKIWFPCKDHPSDEPDSAAINITIPEPYFCASNGILRNVTNPRPGFRTFHWFTSYPINNYNINISIGRYEAVTDTYHVEDGSTMPVTYYVLPGSRQKADTLVRMAIDMIGTYRKFFGEYPFTREKFGLVQTDYLGMEHQTINAYGNRYKFRNFQGITFDWLMLHEMGHEWWGNKVTVSDWADMWIQEGICVYGEALYVLDKAGEEAYHDYMREVQGKVQNKSPIIPGRNITSSEVYQRDIYQKGASLMHSMRYILGDSVFFPALKRFATDSAYTYKNLVTNDDFISLFNGAPQHDFTEYINMFLLTTDLPQFEIDSIASDTYKIYGSNISFNLPIDLTLDGETERIQIGKDAIEVNCSSWPILDERGWYLKLVRRKTAKHKLDG